MHAYTGGLILPKLTAVDVNTITDINKQIRHKKPQSGSTFAAKQVDKGAQFHDRKSYNVMYNTVDLTNMCYEGFDDYSR